MMLIYTASSAQFYGWHNPSLLTAAHDGVTFTVASNTTEYADNNRVRVTASTHLGGDDYMLDVSAPSGIALTSLDFPADKWCFMIQMEDPGSPSTYKVGTNTRLDVVSFDPILGELYVRVPTPAGVTVTPAAFQYGVNDRVQLIRVPTYRWLYLEPRGVLTCHPYNHADGTGGVLPFVVSTNVYFNGGIINASGKGYHIGGSYTLGQGTAGAPANPSKTGSQGWPGGPFPYASINSHGFGTNPPLTLDPIDNGYLCGIPGTGSPADFDLTNMMPGNTGHDANNAAASANNTSGTIETYDPTTPTTSSAWSVIRMGNAGDPGSYGATGGGGGGYGADGSLNGRLGVSGFGLQGADGLGGGDAADGSGAG